MLLQILDIDYYMNNRPMIRIFGKTEDGKTVCCFFDRFLPYFYVKPKKKEDFDKLLEKIKELKLTYDEEDKFLPFGYQEVPERVIKITLNNPQDVPRFREILEKDAETYESDILFKYRFMADFGVRGMGWVEVDCEKSFTRASKIPSYRIKKIRPVDEKKENAPLRYMAIDIECLPTDTRRELDAKKDPIIMVALSFEPEFRGMRSVVIMAKPFAGSHEKKNAIISLPNEKEMLEKTLQLIDEFDPDVVTGYNINNFDIPYVLERLQKLGIAPTFGRCDKPVFSRTFGAAQEATVSGRVVVDPYQILKRDPGVRLHRYNLNTVARVMLGEQKDDITYGEMPGYWNGSEEEVRKLIEYARKDAELSIKLLLQKKLLDKFFELAKISGVLLQDSLGGQAVRIEHMLLTEFKKRNILMPIRPSKHDLGRRMKDRLKGATVLEPKKGLYSNCVLVLDFQSLYPSIIKNYNISPDTLLPEGKQLNHYESPIGAKFVHEEIYEGVFPYVLNNLLATRTAVKKLMKSATGEERRILDAKQNALKILANSFYGYCGYVRARLYKMEIAGSITAYGRDNIEKTKKMIEDNFGVEVIYGDSATADRFVTIMENGTVKIKNIEKLFEENMNNVEYVGEKEIVRLNGDYKALSMNIEKGQVAWEKINKVIRHKTNKKIFRVGQKFGETVVTEDHSLITEHGGRFIETKPTEMIDKKMVKLDKIPEVTIIDKIDLYEILKPYFYKIQYKGREKKVEVKINPGHIYFGWTAREKPIRIRQTFDVQSEEFEALCRLIGAYISEGSSSTTETTKTKFGASIASNDLEWLEQLRKDYKLLFENAKACVIRSTKKKRRLTYAGNGGEKTIEYHDHTHKLQMMNGLAAVLFKMMCGQKSAGKKLPDFVYHLPEKYQKIILDNMIKGDGSRKFMNKNLPYSENYKEKNFRYETKSLHLASGLSLLLTMLNIKHEIRYRPEKTTYIITTTSKYNSVVRTTLTEEKYDGYVYDLEVDNSHTFVDSCGQVLLHNTDSIFIDSKLTDLDEAGTLGEKISKFISENSRFYLEFEKTYRTFVILTKKRYAGWKFEKSTDKETGQQKWTDSIDMRGIETVRRDWCPLVTETMVDVIDIVLKEGDIHKAINSVRDVVNNLNANNVPLEKLTIVKGITKSIQSYDGVLPHIELARKMAARNPNESPHVGDRVGFVIIRGSDMLSKRAEDPNHIKKHNLCIDADYYINNQLLPPIERILYAVGVERSELVGNGRQVSIADIFAGIKSRKNRLVAQNTVQDTGTDIVCKKCSKMYRRIPLRGICECGGEFI